MSKGEKAADNRKKKAGTKAGKQYVSATKKGKVTKSHTKRNESSFDELMMQIMKEEYELVLSEKKAKKCWPGYEKDPDIPRGEQGSCVKKEEQEEKELKDFVEKLIREEYESVKLDEETAKDRMACNKPRYIKKGEPGYGKKQKVVKACKDGKEKIVRFGDANMENKSDSASNKSNFRSRHNCSDKKDKFKAGYWSCKDW